MPAAPTYKTENRQYSARLARSENVAYWAYCRFGKGALAHDGGKRAFRMP